jgi:hypothetical protein
VDEGALRIGEELVAVPELAADLEPPSPLVPELRGDCQGSVDVNRLQEPDREPRRDRRKAIPRREQAARFVQSRADETAVDEPRRRLMLLAEREGRAVRAQTLPFWGGESDTGRIFATAPAARVVVWRNSQRIPPRSKWALKKFSDPDVAIAAEAEISRASVAAATICAKR